MTIRYCIAMIVILVISGADAYASTVRSADNFTAIEWNYTYTRIGGTYYAGLMAVPMGSFAKCLYQGDGRAVFLSAGFSLMSLSTLREGDNFVIEWSETAVPIEFQDELRITKRFSIMPFITVIPAFYDVQFDRGSGYVSDQSDLDVRDRYDGYGSLDVQVGGGIRLRYAFSDGPRRPGMYFVYKTVRGMISDARVFGSHFGLGFSFGF